jgi:quinol-cytochrome oxidoreductase complex cytochrome b subunit
MIAKAFDWLDARTGIKQWAQAKKAQAVPAHSFFFCFGGISLLIIILQVLTGIFLLFYYTPDPKQALYSLDFLSKAVIAKDDCYDD